MMNYARYYLTPEPRRYRSRILPLVRAQLGRSFTLNTRDNKVNHLSELVIKLTQTHMLAPLSSSRVKFFAFRIGKITLHINTLRVLLTIKRTFFSVINKALRKITPVILLKEKFNQNYTCKKKSRNFPKDNVINMCVCKKIQ